MNEITVVSLGVSADGLTLGALEAMKQAKRVILRTAQTPAAAYLDGQGIAYSSLDPLYETAEDFDSLNAALAGAIVLWILALACEFAAIMALTKNFTIRFTKNGNTNMLILLIGFIVLDFIFAVIAAQLWKKANRIKPMSEKNKFLFYLWNEMGVIMACICFIPLIILLLKSNKLDKKTKTIVTAVAAAALLIAGVTSADYHPVSAEQKAEAETSITDDVYWTTFGHKYHLDVDCQAIVNSNTAYEGTVTEAIESGRTAICSFCAKRHADELDLDALNVEKEIGEEEAVAPAA